jgi:hypothetical protein
VGGAAGDGDGDDIAGARGGLVRGEVHEAVVAGPARHAVGRGVLAALTFGHQDLDACAGLLLILLVGGLLDQGGKPLVALLHRGRGHLSVHRRGGGARADGVAERERAREPGLAHQVQGVLEVPVGLAGETDDDVGGDSGARNPRPDPVQDRQVAVPAVGATHRLQDFV